MTPMSCLDEKTDIISEFVKGLLAVPSSQLLEDAPIQLNQTAEYVRKLLDFVYATGPVPLDSAKECQALLEMCDHLQMSELRKLLWKLIKARVYVKKPDANAFGLSPWEAFRLGAVMDSPELCSSAAVAFFRYGYEVDDICNQPTAAYEDIASRYLATLLMDNYKQYGESYKQCSMSTIALRFVEMESET